MTCENCMKLMFQYPYIKFYENTAMYCLYLLLCCDSRVECNCDSMYGLQNLKYLLFDLLQKTLANLI